jgi:hypothetical protein
MLATPAPRREEKYISAGVAVAQYPLYDSRLWRQCEQHHEQAEGMKPIEGSLTP